MRETIIRNWQGGNVCINSHIDDAMMMLTAVTAHDGKADTHCALLFTGVGDHYYSVTIIEDGAICKLAHHDAVNTSWQDEWQHEVRHLADRLHVDCEELAQYAVTV